jgi:hypothetical protein
MKKNKQTSRVSAISRSQRKLLRDLFIGSTVLDVDFSMWYRHVNLIVASDEYLWKNNRPQVYKIMCRHIKHFDFRVTVWPKSESRMCILGGRIVKNKQGIRIILNEIEYTAIAKAYAPIIDVTCVAVSVVPMSTWYIDRTRPGWWKEPYCGLVRPNFEEIALRASGQFVDKKVKYNIEQNIHRGYKNSPPLYLQD